MVDQVVVIGICLELRKWLTSADELVANPSIIVKDEPMGLDARVAAIVMQTVRNTVDTGRTMLCSVHHTPAEYEDSRSLRREKILKIPLGDGSFPDKLLWIPGNNGVFSVSSAYTFFMQRWRAQKDFPECSRRDLEEKCWAGIWKLNIKNKVKGFFWRYLNDALPTAENLCRRKIKLKAYCEGCGEQEESLMHMLFHCQRMFFLYNGILCNRRVLVCGTGGGRLVWTGKLRG